MTKKLETGISRDEIKREFQIERMILFSDAVFAIVITLMAIEIKIPESLEKLNNETLLKGIKHLIPVFIAYVASFFFIGITWYQHLKIFSLVKDYDKGLIVRNLILLFFIALFPFGASVITRSSGSGIAFSIYVSIILCCTVSQYALQYYVVKQKPSLRINVDIASHEKELKERGILLSLFAVAFFLCIITLYFVKDENIRALTPLWIVGAVGVYRIIISTMKRK